MTAGRRREGNENEDSQTKRGQGRRNRASEQEELMLISGRPVSWTEAGLVGLVVSSLCSEADENKQ